MKEATDHLAELNAALTNRYVVERELGAGGMATVYLARDLKHDRPVAVKVLRPEVASTIGADRFLLEVRITANLSHPRILPLLDSGCARAQSSDGGADALYYVMPFIEGETLRSRLRRECQLSIGDAVDIILQVADALSYAHSRGILHRDIKPENILLERGHALVADFGIARAITSAGGEHLTWTGLAIGTPAYMSPEQATGERDVDQRSDVYSLACVAYEMLVGEPPFTGPTAQAQIARRLTETPRPMRATRDAVSVALDTAIARALARAPADRFASVDELANALRAAQSPATDAPASTPIPAIPKVRRSPWWPIAIGALVAAGVIVTLSLSRRRGDEIAASIHPPRIAVLPFENLGGQDDEAFAAGVTEEITNRLAEVSGLQVVSRTSAKRFQGKAVSIGDIGKALNADYVLEGTVRTDRAEVGREMARVAPQLIRVANDAHIWQRQFDARLAAGDIFRVQADIASQVAAAMNVTLLADEKRRVGRIATTDSVAYRLYQFGRFQWEKRSPDALILAKQYFRQAIERDPNYARAWAGLGDASFVYVLNVMPESGRAESAAAVAALRRAVALDSTLAEGHAGLGYALTFTKWDWAGADSAFRRAISLDPSYAPAHYWYAQLLLATGARALAEREARLAVQLDPLSAVAHLVLGLVLVVGPTHDEGLVELRRATELQPGYVTAQFFLAFEYLRRGELPAGQEALRQYLSTSFPGRSMSDTTVRALAGVIGGHGDAAATIHRLAASGVDLGNMVNALLFAQTRMNDSAFARLRAAIATHSLQIAPRMAYIEQWLRDDPRWPTTLRSIGLTR